jgi:hypothetical protein
MVMNEPKRTDEPTPEWIRNHDSPLRSVHHHLYQNAARFFGYDTVEGTGLAKGKVTEQGAWRLVNGSSGPWAAMHCPTRTVYVYKWGSNDAEATADVLRDLTSPAFTIIACTEEVCRDDDGELSPRGMGGSNRRRKPRVVGGVPDDNSLRDHLLMGDVPEPTEASCHFRLQIHLPSD